MTADSPTPSAASESDEELEDILTYSFDSTAGSSPTGHLHAIAAALADADRDDTDSIDLCPFAAYGVTNGLEQPFKKTIASLFNINSTHWVQHIAGFASLVLDEELELYELLDYDAAGEVVDETLYGLITGGRDQYGGSHDWSRDRYNTASRIACPSRTKDPTFEKCDGTVWKTPLRAGRRRGELNNSPSATRWHVDVQGLRATEQIALGSAPFSNLLAESSDPINPRGARGARAQALRSSSSFCASPSSQAVRQKLKANGNFDISTGLHSPIVARG
ncbi:hypothetical protein GY45DRAFT_1395736 [Cubamyces sp. BRFM 1775]|nr:hypothetical protein GY45DRAFT_1395736 [Cubamyces sp. BRFM 1775]